ncbi:MAG: PIN domain-containing protein [Actinomycetes bacterium]|jgi:predicted nucleic acid-binding protein
MGRVILDSSVLVAANYSQDKHHSLVSKYLSESPKENQYFISCISLAESLVHATRKGHGEEMKNLIVNSVAEVFEVELEIAVFGSQIRAQTNLLLPDSLISATAQIRGCILWTLDKKLASVHAGAILLN